MTAIQTPRITWTRFLEMDFPENDFIYELIDGIIMQRSSPNPIHQRVVRKISALFEKAIESHQPGEFFPAPLDVFPGEFTCVQPDLVFVLVEGRYTLHAFLENDETAQSAVLGGMICALDDLFN